MYSKNKTTDGYVYTISNPLVLIKGSGIIKLTDGSSFQFNKNTKKDTLSLVYFALDYGIRFGNSEHKWKYDSIKGIIETPTKLKFSIKNFDGFILAETFLFDIHFCGFDLSNKIVIEGGAFVGDTALYYANMGARVYSFEPDEKLFQLAKENISLNKSLQSRITLNNWAIGNDGYVSFSQLQNVSSKNNIVKTAKVRSISISRILEELGILDPYLLHLDIKGAEFDVINDTSLSRFQRIRIEYSIFLVDDINKNLEYLLSKLDEYGFRHVRVFKHNSMRYDLLTHGTIDASK